MLKEDAYWVNIQGYLSLCHPNFFKNTNDKRSKISKTSNNTKKESVSGENDINDKDTIQNSLRPAKEYARLSGFYKLKSGIL